MKGLGLAVLPLLLSAPVSANADEMFYDGDVQVLHADGSIEDISMPRFYEENEGVFVSAQSFEAYFSSKIQTQTPYLLDKKGQDIRLLAFEPEPLFLLTDHTPMPRNSKKSLLKSGISTVSVGPTILHSSQCIAVVLNELDRKFR